ncbi:MAG: alpha-L-fucosidase [Ruminococcaceae bacterium]|nr:alpha-L-fucosidase [Oscillospiraceae bacterium]
MSSYVRRKTPGDTDWLVHDRFGMFIHFGLYSMLARHEWIREREDISDEDYEIYFKHFNPDLFDARDLARRAREAGMKYAILTTRHHEGFSLFDTQYSDYKITNTPFGRDLVREYVDAFRAEGLKIGFYYSLLDWHHPHYTIDQCHPLRNRPDAMELNKGRDMKIYAEFMRNQVRELMTNYGHIDVLWFDFSFKNNWYNGKYAFLDGGKGKGREEWEADKLLEMVRSLQPHIVINDRLEIPQDVVTPEQRQLDKWPQFENGEYKTWEACQTFSGSWGYYRDEMTWKSPEMLIEMLIKTVACGGNLLMNVGPCARGYIDERATNALDVYAKWMRYNSRSIYGCTMAEPEFKAPAGTYLTQSEDGSRLYIHLFTYPFKTLVMQNLGDKIEYAQFLHDASEIVYQVAGIEGSYEAGSYREIEKNAADLVTFNLPVVKPNQTVPVIEVFLKK